MSTPLQKLFGHVEPHAGETLLSLITRSAELNVHHRLHAFLRLGGVKMLKPDHIPFTRIHDAEKLSAWMGVDQSKISAAMHPAISLGYEDFVHWYGTRIPRRFIDAKVYRYSPATLKDGAFQRALWTLRPLAFCPYSKELLLDSCPVCGRRQGWRYRSSMDICGKCRVPLTAARTLRLSEEDSDDAVNAAFLASPDRSERQRALELLPDPFCHWDGGEALAAIVELGALPIGEARRRRSLVREIKNGDFSSFEISDLVRGYRFAKKWPESIAEELEQHAINDTVQRTLQLTALAGPFGKYFHKSNNPTPLTKLVRDAVPSALYSLGVVPSQSSGCCPDWVRKGSTITQSEAIKLFEMDAGTLRRLHGQGECVVMIRQQGSGNLYDAEKLGASVALMRSAARESDCAADLGIPRHCAGQLQESGLLRQLCDQDALLMAGCPLFDPTSLRELRSRLNTVPIIKGHGTQTVQTLLRGRFHPADWADAIAAILAGRMGFVRRSKSGPILAKGMLESDSARLFLAKLPHRDPPSDVAVSAASASIILGVTQGIISCAVSLRLLKTERVHNPLRISLSELERFHRAFISGAEGDRLISCKRGQFSRLMSAEGIDPIAKLYGNAFWDRATVEKHCEKTAGRNWKARRCSSV